MKDHASRGLDPARGEFSRLRKQHRRLRDLAGRLAAAEDSEERTLLLHLVHDAYGAARRARGALGSGLQNMLLPVPDEERARRAIDELLEQLLRMVPGGLAFRDRALLLRDGLLPYIGDEEGMMQLALRRTAH